MLLEAQMPKMIIKNTVQPIPTDGTAFAWAPFEMSMRCPKATWILLLLATDP